MEDSPVGVSFLEQRLDAHRQRAAEGSTLSLKLVQDSGHVSGTHALIRIQPFPHGVPHRSAQSAVS